MKRTVSFILAFVAATMIGMFGSTPVIAGVIPSRPTCDNPSELETKLNAAVVHARLMELGFSSADAEMLVSQMSENDLAVYAANPEQIQISGMGGAATAILVIVGFAIIWIILLQLGINPFVK